MVWWITTVELIVIPGFIFMIAMGLFYQWVDRKFYAKLQNRYGPLHTGPKGLYQPLADLIKLLAKEDIVPAAANKFLFTLTPILLLAIPMTALFCVPIVTETAFIAFEGDVIFVIFALTIIAVMQFFGAWGSTSRFSTVGGMRVALQLFGYEVPLGIVLLAPAIAAGTLSISGMAAWITQNPLVFFLLLPGFIIAMFCFLAELEKVPFDIPEAETEIVAGWLTEFSGRRLGMIRLGIDIELFLAGALIAAIFLGGPNGPTFPPIPNEIFYFIWFIIKTTVVVLIISNLRAVFARLRIGQMVQFAWMYLLPIAVLQVVLVQLYAAGYLGAILGV
jgi:NADH-quinone oxidoreductase subunit H